MKWSQLSEEDRADISARWEGWFRDGALATIDPAEMQRRTIEELVQQGHDRAQVEEGIAEGAGAIFGQVALTENLLIDGLTELFQGHPTLGPIVDGTPVIVLPTYDYEAFAHSLHSGTPYVAISLMTVTATFLLAEQVYRAIGTVENADVNLLNQMANHIIVTAWHLHSDNIELAGFLSREARMEGEDYRQVPSVAHSMIAFLLLHELAHVALGHRPSRDPVVVRTQELEADRQAATWWTEVLSPRNHWELPVHGLWALFQSYALGNDLADQQPQNYPTWEERYAQVKQVVAESDIPTILADGVEVLFAVVRERARRAILFSNNQAGDLVPYANPQALLRATNDLAAGRNDLLMLMIGPDGKLHERALTPEALQERMARDRNPD